MAIDRSTDPTAAGAFADDESAARALAVADAGRRARGDLARLVAAQALHYCVASADLTLTALAGLALAPTPLLATVPLTLAMAAAFLASVAGGFVAGRWGYRRTMSAGALVGAVGALVAAAGAVAGSFWVLGIGTALVGVHQGMGGYIRYLAADLAPAGGRERALSAVLLGGLVAAVVGPFAAVAASSVLATPYVGSFLLVALLAAASAVLIRTVSREPAPTRAPSRARARGAASEGSSAADGPATGPIAIREGLRNRDARTALVVLPFAGATMVLMMAVGPLAGAHAGHHGAEGASLIQWHLVGMFLPSLVTGRLTERWGPRPIAAAGAAIVALSGVVGAMGDALAPMVAAMALIGLGWNLLYVAGTALLLRSYPPGRGGRLQSLAEGVGGAATVAASLVSAAAFAGLGWRGTSTIEVVAGVALVGWLALTGFAAAGRVRRSRRSAPTAERGGGVVGPEVRP
ncbi:MFS transporter [Agromyces sp. MMS24-K17]|uniref:MFS transporter n=1 Tax=Agromyces sp. MMS24-K17 TaxID=3372850 RepID=UPI0037542635